jgi:hypothetical protein
MQKRKTYTRAFKLEVVREPLVKDVAVCCPGW